jgi:hypothetical protein
LQHLWVRTVFFVDHIQGDDEEERRPVAISDDFGAFRLFLEAVDVDLWVERLRRVKEAGVRGVKAKRTFREIILPPLVTLAFAIAIPHFVSFCVAVLTIELAPLDDSQAIKIAGMLLRLPWMVFGQTACGFLLLAMLSNSLGSLKRQIVDDKYLVGTRISNRQETEVS